MFSFTPNEDAQALIELANQALPPSGKASGAGSDSTRPAAAPHKEHTAPRVAAANTSTTVLPEQALTDPLSNPDAEFDLCGWLLRMTPEQLPQANRLFSMLTEKDITHPVFRNIVKAARYLVDREELVAASSVLDYAHTHGLDVGGPEHLAQLITDPIGSHAQDGHIEQGVMSILDYTARRRVRDILQFQLNELAKKKPIGTIANELLDAATELQGAAEGKLDEPVHISGIVENLLEDLFDETPSSAPMSTGYPEIDEKLNGGIRDQDVVIVAGRPGMGKTAFAINGLARNMSLDTRHHRPVLVFSLEMSKNSLASRLVAAEAGVPAKFFRTGDVSSAAFHQALSEIMPRFGPYKEDPGSIGSRLWIDDTPGLTVAELRNRARQFTIQYGRPIIIIDYLQLLAGDDPKLVGIVSGQLRKLARELDTPIIALSQLNRSLESRTNKQPILSDLRESGNIEQDATIIIFMYRDVVYNADTPDPDDALAIIAKQRDGEIGPVSLRFNGPLVRFESRVPTAYETETIPDAPPADPGGTTWAYNDADYEVADDGSVIQVDCDPPMDDEEDFYDPSMQ